MTRRRNLTEGEKAWAAQEREKGRSLDDIADELGCSRGSVEWHCLLVGADPPKVRQPAPVPTEPIILKRGGRQVRRFTQAEDSQLLAMSLENKTDTEIGRALKRRSHSIRGRLATLARREARAEAD